MKALENEIRKGAKGQAAPVAAFDLMRQTAKLPYAQGVSEERAVFVYLRASAEAKALRQMFLAEREAGRIPGQENLKLPEIRTVGIVGGGLMGCGIGYAALSAGFGVVMLEAGGEALEKARERMRGLMDASVSSGRLTSEKRGRMEAVLGWTTEFSAFAGADLVIEAVFEDMTVKKDVLSRIEAAVGPECLIATNTSYLDPNVMAAGMKAPERFLGLHFFSPAHIMRLLEVVRCRGASVETLAAGVAFGRRIGKVPVITGVCEGFCGNRILKAYRIVAETLVEDGASPWEVDAAMTEFGFPMGPFAVQDMAGLEIAYANRKTSPALRADGVKLGLVELLVESGRLGRKNGKGWYAYPDGAKTGAPDPDVDNLIEAYRTQRLIPHKRFSRHAIREALLEAMRQEGQALLAEGIVARPEEVNLVLALGYGYPVHKGGPLA